MSFSIPLPIRHMRDEAEGRGKFMLISSIASQDEHVYIFSNFSFVFLFFWGKCSNIKYLCFKMLFNIVFLFTIHISLFSLLRHTLTHESFPHASFSSQGAVVVVSACECDKRQSVQEQMGQDSRRWRIGECKMYSHKILHTLKYIICTYIRFLFCLTIFYDFLKENMRIGWKIWEITWKS